MCRRQILRRDRQDGSRRNICPGDQLKITDVEAVILCRPELDEGIADGSQEDLVIRVHTDAGIGGIGGIGEVDSSPELVQIIRELLAEPAPAA